MTICSTTWWATPGSVFWSRSSSTAPGGQRAERGTPLSAAPGPSPRRTVGQRLAQLQQAAERQRSHVRFPPAVRLLLHVLLKLDPARRLLPLQLLVLVQHQLVQLHEHLRRHGSVGCPAAQRGAAPAPHPTPPRPPPAPPSRYDTHLVGLPVRPARPRALLAVLLTHVHHLRLGALPHQVPPHAGHVLKAVTCTGHGDAARGWARAAGAAVRRGAGGGEERPRTAGARAAPESAVVARAVPEGSELRPRSPLGRHRRRFPLRAPGPARPAHRSGTPRPRRPPQTPPPPSDPTAAGARAPHALFM